MIRRPSRRDPQARQALEDLAEEACRALRGREQLGSRVRVERAACTTGTSSTGTQGATSCTNTAPCNCTPASPCNVAYTARRKIIDNAKCLNCHGALGSNPSFHAGQRNDGESCAFCHNPNQTSAGWSPFGKSGVASSYGAAASVITILLWVYYSSQILLFGAEFTKAYSEQHGSRAEKRKARA